MIRKISIIWFLLSLCIVGVQAQFNLNDLVPVDTAVRIGKLDNGLTYYIRKNQEPKERATFYMIQNVGALLEEDAQNGLAHFLEHMAFNGTKHFEGKGILNTLQRYGVAFGRNINASTSYQETVYYLSDVPVTVPGLMDSCLLILNDWSDYLLLSDEEIDLERGVITEEWRTRRTSSVRLQDQYLPVLFKGSKYAVRDVIGKMDIIKNFKPDELRSFYHSWYRTDLQAIAVVGDFDVDQMEAKVKALFSTIQPVQNPLKREKYEIPAHREPYFMVATDKEETQSDVGVVMMTPNRDEQPKTWKDVREGYLRSLYNNMLSLRIQELLQKGTPPFVSGSSRIGGFVRGYDVYSVDVTAKPNEEAGALKAIWTETERVRRFGFTTTELERAKTNMLTQWESRYKQRDKISSQSFCASYSSHYLKASAIPGIDTEYSFVKQVLPTITTDELLAAARFWITKENRIIIVTGPSEGATHITESEALAVLAKVEQEDIRPYEDGAASTSLISAPLQGGKVVSTKLMPELNAVEWTLSNHAKVVFCHADYEKDQVSLMGLSFGGSSLFENDYMPSAGLLGSFMPAFGVGDFDAVTLRKVLTGKRVSVSPNVSEVSEGLSGSSTPKDFETMLQLMYLYFETPRFDKEAYEALMSRMEASIVDMQKNPAKVMSDSISAIMSSYNPRIRPVSVDFLKDVSFEKIQEIYKNRIQDAGDFTFIIVGNLPEDSVKLLAEKYIGALTDKPRTETWVDRGVRSPKGKLTKSIAIQMTTPKTTVSVSYSGNVTYNAYNIWMFQILGKVLTLRYTDIIREKEGGTYGVSVVPMLAKYPLEKGVVSISFDCEASRAAYLKTLVYQQLDSLMIEGPRKVDFDKTIQNLKKEREQSKVHNSYWSIALMHYYMYDGAINPASPEFFEAFIDKITVQDVQKFAREYFSKADVVDLEFHPKLAEEK